MEQEQLDERGILDAGKQITHLVGLLPSARMQNPALAVSLMSLVARGYANSIRTSAEPHQIAMLPGNAELWDAICVDGAYADANLFGRLKSTISRAVAEVFPDIARFAVGVDVSLMAAAKMRRCYDLADARINQYREEHGKTDEGTPFIGLREALLRGGTGAGRLGPIALEAIHDVVFTSILTESERERFAAHAFEDVTDSFASALSAFDGWRKHERIATVINSNLQLADDTAIQSIRLHLGLAA